MPDNEYIILYEEPVDSARPRDDVTIDVDLEAERLNHRVEAEFGAAVSNTTSGWAIAGLILTLIGGLLAVITAIIYAIYYPDRWWPEPTSGVPRLVQSFSLIALFLLIIGNLMIGFGRRLKARGVLHKVRFLPAED